MGRLGWKQFRPFQLHIHCLFDALINGKPTLQEAKSPFQRNVGYIWEHDAVSHLVAVLAHIEWAHLSMATRMLHAALRNQNKTSVCNAERLPKPADTLMRCAWKLTKVV